MFFACSGAEGRSVHFSENVTFCDVVAENQYGPEPLCRPTKQTNNRRFPARPVEDFNHFASTCASIAAIQRAVDLAEGQGITHVLDDTTGIWAEDEMYAGSVKHQPNDNRRTPVLWTKRHCRRYTDPYRGSVPGTNPAYFKVCTVKDGKLDGIDINNFYHMGHNCDGEGNLL